MVTCDVASVQLILLLLVGELLAECCRTDDLTKYLSPLPSSMPCGLRNSVTVRHPQSFSAKWFLDDRRVSCSQMVDVVRQR